MKDRKDTPYSLPEKLEFNLAILGGGRTCKNLLELLQTDPFPYLSIHIIGVCDVNQEAVGYCLAKELGIYTTNDFQDLFKLKGLDGVIELTNRRDVLLDLIRLRPQGIGVLEHNMGKLLRSLLTINHRLKSAEQQVALERMASSFLIQKTNERIIIMNPDFTIVEANNAYLKAVDKAQEEVIGAHCYEVTHGLNAPCPISQPELGCPMLETLKSGRSAQVIHEHFTPDQQSVYCDLVTYPIKDQDGHIVRIIEIWRDITEELSLRWEKRVKELRADMKKLIQEDRMISLGKLVASCVHEINNPIQGLLTFTHLILEILAEGLPNPEEMEKIKGHLSVMSTELERCGNIVSSLLSFSRKTNKEYNHLDLNEVLKAVISLTRHKMDLQEIELNVELVPRPLLMHGDANQLQQCFLNLIFNAIEAMPEGGRLWISTELDLTEKMVKVEIKDTGCGINSEYLDHIFDPFFTTKEEGEGTGLGLSIVYGVIKTHRGDIEVNSKVGEGSSFTLNFPLQ